MTLRPRVTAVTRFIKEHLLWTEWKIAPVKTLPALLTYIIFTRKASLITKFIRNFSNSFLLINFCIWIQHRVMQWELWKYIIILNQGYICQWVWQRGRFKVSFFSAKHIYKQYGILLKTLCYHWSLYLAPLSPNKLDAVWGGWCHCPQGAVISVLHFLYQNLHMFQIRHKNKSKKLY